MLVCAFSVVKIYFTRARENIALALRGGDFGLEALLAPVWLSST
jgi:hypothetical protein